LAWAGLGLAGAACWWTGLVLSVGPPGWPVVLADGPVLLRPYRRSDARAWAAIRRANEAWLAQWEPTPYGSWRELNSPAAFRAVYADLRRAGRHGVAMPFAVCVRDVVPSGGELASGGSVGGGRLAAASGRERLVGQLTLGNIVRRAFCSAYAGYWIDSSAAGRGVMPTALALAVDHAFRVGGLHRIEVNIRPENRASRRVVEKLGFREEAYHPRYLHIDGAWRDHVGYALTAEDVAAEGGLLARWHRVRA
jgi:[ribosomal protein S5]-alanine N-acetyltransferase